MVEAVPAQYKLLFFHLDREIPKMSLSVCQVVLARMSALSFASVHGFEIDVRRYLNSPALFDARAAQALAPL